MPATHDHKARLPIRPLQAGDLAGVAALSVHVYGSGYSQDIVRRQLGHFFDGQFGQRPPPRPVSGFLGGEGHTRVTGS